MTETSSIKLGATPEKKGVRFAVRSETAERVWFSVFNKKGDDEIARVELTRDGTVFSGLVPKLKAGARYGFRADGPYDPARGLWFDPDKLLIDPYAAAIDGPYHYDARLGAKRGEGGDTAPLLPKCVVVEETGPLRLEAPRFAPGGLIYELSVRAFTMLHPKVPKKKRGTVAALAEPAVIEHLKTLGVAAVELMPITATMDERHLPSLGLSNAWGYNPVTFMALDPRLVPGGMAELRQTVAKLHEAGIGVILDLVFNHTAESDAEGPTLSLRGLDAPAYFRHAENGALINDTGTGNTVRTDHPAVQAMVLESLRRFVELAGVDGFRFDLGTVLGRGENGFARDAPLLDAIRNHPVIGSRLLVMEPWDIGPGGYQLGRFGAPFLEWNDRARDDIRRFWRGDGGMAGQLATRIAGSFDLFDGEATRSVNFLAAHDGFTLADTVAYQAKHNEANGEENRDGHDDNHSWNNGAEGPSDDPHVLDARRRDIRALLSTLFVSRGAIMLTAGDEWGRTQHGNNNAYAQDNERFRLDWKNRDKGLEAHVAALASLRRQVPALHDLGHLSEATAWLGADGVSLSPQRWEEPERRRFTLLLKTGSSDGSRLAIVINGDRRAQHFALPQRDGWRWELAVPEEARIGLDGVVADGRTVVILIERAAG
ncbi:glycogen debranching protein GlgX [Mesorhizobium sp. RP14(2022)]|uniref:Glycogen debranching protein GlgX n=1 Tax=Mesorhizobium liriopis TaxID=2953882 RepID=A0ABT1C2X9_9HYPH|nr:glycogen debranching protein GlgX [Mesorhizobium liriopis]MCO6048590.1 glycogen debranching protein GlgX [Mesorhizobium liriopis]